MLRLVLDAMQPLNISDHPLRFVEGATWYSEARLTSPFLRKSKKELPNQEKDTLGEGYTNADGVIGHFIFRDGTKAGLTLAKGARQFIVVEAKLLSNLSAGTTNALTYNQAARNIACMAETIRQGHMAVADFESVGFFVVAPKDQLEKKGRRNSQVYLSREAITQATEDRLESYKNALRYDANLMKWNEIFNTLLSRIAPKDRVPALSWEDIIHSISEADQKSGEILQSFYNSCLGHARTRPYPVIMKPVTTSNPVI
jgi:hypothetical protein